MQSKNILFTIIFIVSLPHTITATMLKPSLLNLEKALQELSNVIQYQSNIIQQEEPADIFVKHILNKVVHGQSLPTSLLLVFTQLNNLLHPYSLILHGKPEQFMDKLHNEIVLHLMSKPASVIGSKITEMAILENNLNKVLPEAKNEKNPYTIEILKKFPATMALFVSHIENKIKSNKKEWEKIPYKKSNLYDKLMSALDNELKPFAHKVNTLFQEIANQLQQSDQDWEADLDELMKSLEY